MFDWDFLTDTIDSNALLLDCRSEEAHENLTVRDACGVALIKKPFGSGPKSMVKLSGFIEEIIKLSKDKDSIIAFDEGQGMFASRMLWVLKAAGYKNGKMYSRKFTEMPKESLGKGRGQLNPEPTKAPAAFKGVASLSFVQQNLTRVQLLDVRTPQEYEGQVPRLTNPDPGGICGRIPGSINWDWRLLYDGEGRLRSKMQIIPEIKRIGLIQERPTVIYDFNGARSSTMALVLNDCGYRQVHVYLGSWMEWRKTELPKQNVSFWHPDD